MGPTAGPKAVGIRATAARLDSTDISRAVNNIHNQHFKAPPFVTSKNITFFPHRAFMSFIYVSDRTAIFFTL